MKKLLQVTLIIFTGLIYAQEQVLFSGITSHGGFGGPVLKLSQFDDDLGLLVGGRGGWIIGHMITIGGGGYGLTNDIPVLYDNTDTTKFLDFGYGGFEIGLILASSDMIHFSINSLIGGGAIGYRESIFDGHMNHDWDYDQRHDQVFVVEPAANLIINVTKWFRVGVGLSYRHVTGVDLVAIDNQYVSGPSGVLSFKFGSF